MVPEAIFWRQLQELFDDVMHNISWFWEVKTACLGLFRFFNCAAVSVQKKPLRQDELRDIQDAYICAENKY